jgi:ATP/maltotriose-dependent transcriptional regulator MalT
MATTVIGREQELEAIEAFLAAAEQGPRALVLSGEAGIGKTILWEAGVEEAERRFARVLVHRGIEAESSLSFAGLSDLLEPAMEDIVPSIPAPRRRALEVALWLADPGEQPPEPSAIGLAVLDVLRALAAEGPVCIALDDIQWLDGASALALQIAVRRLRQEHVGLLATLRSSPESSTPLELARAFREERYQQLTIGPLTLAAVHSLLKERLGLELTRPELVRLGEMTAGNPFFALELGREMVRTNTRPTAGRGVPVPEGLRGLLDERLARLPAETVDVLLQVAALARPTVDLVASAYGDRERVLRGLEEAGREGVVELDDSRIRFSHPLLASICYEQAPLWKRRAVHRVLAGTVGDTEERARHLALAAEGPDARVAAELDTASGQAASRGATAGAAELLELAAELTPNDALQEQRRLLRAAHFHRLAGNGERAVAILETLRDEVPGGIERADVLFELALTRRASAPGMIALCDEALAETPEDDDVRCSRILAYRSFIRLFQADVREGLVDARSALERAERVGDPTLVAVAIARVGQAQVWAADVTPDLIERGAELEERLGLALEYYESPRVALARLLSASGEVERALSIFEEMAEEAAVRGDEGSRGQILWRVSLLEWYTGRLRRALNHAADALGVADQAHDLHQRIFMGRIKALVETDLGLVESARASAEEGLRLANERSDEVNVFTCLGSLGRLELALGNLEAAGSCLRDVPARALALGYNDPTAPFWADAIETLVLLGELDQAHAYLEPFERHASRMADPWAVAAAARSRGLVCAASGDAREAFEAFDRALVVLDGQPFPLERGRVLLCLGTVRRQLRQKKDAREALDRALEIFEELGAPLWAEKARGELARISGRAPASDELTETERRVAELAAQGRTNKEIAAELFMGLSTVESHLSRVYRKLEIRSRAELAGRIASPRGEAPNPRDEAAQL